MKQRIVYCLLVLFCLTSCMDELPFENTNLGEGSTDVTFTMSFHPETGVSLGETRAAKGDAIKDINNLFIIFFDKSGKDTGIHYYIENPHTTSVKRDTLEDKLPTTELETVQVEQTYNIPYGVYHIYAVANMGDLAINEYKDSIAKGEESFKNIRFAWKKDNIQSNAQMSGYFITGNEYERNEDGTYRRHAKDVTIDRSVKNLHAWLRRAASKVTVDYDATGLREGVTIYLKSVKLKNIPASCCLVNENKPKGEKIAFQGQEMDDLIFDGDGIIYEERPERESADKYILAKGHPYIGDYDYLNDGDEKINEHKKIHDHLSEAMFFYENMQGVGEEHTVTDKRQDVSGKNESISYPNGAECGHPGENEGKPAGEGWRDGKKYGTYVEVDAYYVSNVLGNVGRGPIKYRFMLGKDIITDYNAERNYHYKLTLKFNGNANDVDWHIDYDEDDAPGVYMPDYYVSYLYNQPYVDYETDPDSYWEKCYPIRLAGTTIGNEITVQIIENNWGPDGTASDLASLEYYTGNVYTTSTTAGSANTRKPTLSTSLLRSGVWHGFLSLYKQEGVAEISTSEDNTSWGRYSAGEYIYWYRRGKKAENVNEGAAPLSQANEIRFGEGNRTYKTTLNDNREIGEEVYVDKDNGAYKVVKSIKNGLNETTIYIPLFTRPLVINQKKGFTGNNPYFSYQRTAKLRVETTINNETKTKESTVNQVRRIINPKGVFRSWDNTTPFKVTLMHRTSETPGTDFVPFTSEGGPWRATIVAGQGWHINNNSTQAEGSTNSIISFSVAPDSKLTNSTETACALVRVEYHDYHCVHYIHLRQGYAPLSLDGNTYWHSFNMRYTDNDLAYESDCELDEGSMFRYGNLTKAIDAINNTWDDQFTTTAHYSNSKFILAPVGETERENSLQYATWGEIQPKDEFPKDELTKNTTFTVDGVACRMPKYEDFNTLKTATKTNLDVSFGVCYGDEATGNNANDEDAFYYSWYARKGVPTWLTYQPNRTGADPQGKSGVRGCFVYDHTNGKVIFLPLGACSYGRRKGDGNGILRYADFNDTFEKSVPGQGPYVPLLHNLYKQYGAVYWVSDRFDTQGRGRSADIVVAWDINYSSLDFNPTYAYNLHAENKGEEDAAYIRLVQDTKPTQDQCDKIDARMKAYQGKK